METMWKLVRNKVSGDKTRYTNGNYDLDLTYITDRIIAMSFPADGMESTYRNSINEVAQLLNEKHPEKYKLFNLSERKYDYSKFNGKVQDDIGFPDHHAPPLHKLYYCIETIHQWLLEHPKHIAVIHCLAGKGRTGTVIAAYFLFTGLFTNPKDALDLYASKRSANNWGVTGPSQIRYVEYFSRILHKEIVPLSVPYFLECITISAMPIGGCFPFIHIYQFEQQGGKKLIYSSETPELKWAPGGQPSVFQINPFIIRGDIMINLYNLNSFYRKEELARVQFHTGLINTGGNARIKFYKRELDVAYQDKRFINDGYMEIFLKEAKDAKERKDSKIKWWENIPPIGDGSICFMNLEYFREVKERYNTKRKSLEKAGWLTKQGHQFKTWKRRWFILKNTKLSYYKKPQDTTAAGSIELAEIGDVALRSNKSDLPPYTFEIYTKNETSYLVYADTASESESWIEAIRAAVDHFNASKTLRKSQRLSDDFQFVEDQFKTIPFSCPLNNLNNSSDTAPELSLLIVPESSLGNFVLGMAIGETYYVLQNNSNSVLRSELQYNLKNPQKSDLIVQLQDYGIKLYFDSHTQKLKLIEIDHFDNLKLLTVSNSIKTPLYSQPEELNLKKILELFGAPKFHEMENSSFLLIYQGISFSFHVPDEKLNQIEENQKNFETLTEILSSVSCIYIFSGVDHRSCDIPIIAKSTHFEEVVVIPQRKLKFSNRSIEIFLSETTSNSVLSLLGPPSEVVQINLPNEIIPNEELGQFTFTSDYYFIYHYLGIEFKFNFQNNVLTQFTLYTNSPSDKYFLKFAKCNFKIVFPELEFEITPKTKLKDILKMLGPSYIEDRRLGKDFVSYYYAHLSLLFIILKDEYLASVKVDQKSNSLRDSSNSFLMNNNNTNKQ